MNLIQIIISIFTISLVTIFTRSIIFVIFQPNQKIPDFVIYLGKVLPAAAIAMLVVYSLKDSHFIQYPYALPEFTAIIAIVILHRWKRNVLLSIAGGTLIYMWLVQTVFVAA